MATVRVDGAGRPFLETEHGPLSIGRVYRGVVILRTVEGRPFMWDGQEVEAVVSFHLSPYGFTRPERTAGGGGAQRAGTTQSIPQESVERLIEAVRGAFADRLDTDPRLPHLMRVEEATTRLERLDASIAAAKAGLEKLENERGEVALELKALYDDPLSVEAVPGPSA